MISHPADGKLPLAGLRVAVTRARAQAGGLVAKLAALGAEVLEVPVIRTQTIPGPPPDLTRFDLVCFTSANGVEALFERLRAAGLDARAFPPSGRCHIAAIGAATARALAAHGVSCDLQPKHAVAESLVAALAGLPVKRALVARAATARDVLPDALRARGAEVEVVALYETVSVKLSAEQLRAAAACDLITFTSASTVRGLLSSAGGADGWRAVCAASASQALPGRRDTGPRTRDAGPRIRDAGPLTGPGTRNARQPRMLSIGPLTSAELAAHGLHADIEAERHDVDGMIAALLDARAEPTSAPRARAGKA